MEKAGEKVKKSPNLENSLKMITMREK